MKPAIIISIVLAACTSGESKQSPAAVASAPALSAKTVEPANVATVRLDLPSGWTRTDEAEFVTLELASSVKSESGDPFTFQFMVTPADPAAPTDPAAYGAWHAKKWGATIARTEALGKAVYYEVQAPSGKVRDDGFFVAAKVGDRLWLCQGTLFRGDEYAFMAKVRTQVLADAKAVCASMR